MRFLFLLLTIPLYTGGPALAQVTVNLDALKALSPPSTASGHRDRQTPASRATARSRQARRQVAPALPVPPVPPAEGPPVATASVSPSTALAPPAALPAPAPQNPLASRSPAAPLSALNKPSTPPPPPPAALLSPAPPPQVALAGPLAPPPAPPVAPSAPPASPMSPPAANAGSAPTAANAASLTVTFGAEASDLSTSGAAAVKQLAHSVPENDTISFNVLAYAQGQAADPSSARRLSLARALAVRSALMAAGVPSTRIYVRALGSEAGSGPADRADISVMGANAPATTAAAGPHTTSGGKQE